MGSNILNIGQSALTAAQIGISVTGHNIANASTPGYSRQVVIQGAAEAQNFGYGYLGQGTQVNTVVRMFSELNNRQVMASQSSSSEISAYSTQMKRIDNLLADSSSGLSVVTQDFFNSLQTLSSSPSDVAARQAMLSSAESLAQRFQSLDSQFKQISQELTSEVETSVNVINSYAKQIAKLNEVIEKALSSNENPPNDLMDQRDQLLIDLSKEIKSTVVEESGGKYNVFIGNGLPLVVGKQTYALSTQRSPTDGTRVEIAYQTKDGPAMLGENSLPGGRLGGLLEFRNESLDKIQAELNHIAMSVSMTFNAQHRAGMDSSGTAGTSFFIETTPVVNASANNDGDAEIVANISNIGQTVASDYRLQYDGTNYILTRKSDDLVRTYSTMPVEVDGMNIDITSGTIAAGDDYLIKPGFNAAGKFDVLINSVNQIAVGAPTVSNVAATTNTGTANFSLTGISSSYAASPLASPFTLTYDGSSLSGFPSGEPIQVTIGSTTTDYPADSAIPFTAGATVKVAGMSFTMGGVPQAGDEFTFSATTSSAPGDNRNGLLLAGLRTTSTMYGGSTTYEGAFAQVVSYVGNKTHELEVMGTAEEKMLDQAVAAQQSVSGVNLDEEATNLLRYQQAYQSAAKMMQIASQMFDALLQLGR